MKIIVWLKGHRIKKVEMVKMKKKTNPSCNQINKNQLLQGYIRRMFKALLLSLI